MHTAASSKMTQTMSTAVQLLGNHGPLSARNPGQVFERAARDCKTPLPPATEA